MRVNEGLFDLRFAAAGDDDLSAGINDLIGGGQYQIDAFLMNEARDQPENRAARQRQSELLADVIGVRAFAFPVSRAEWLRQFGESQIHISGFSYNKRLFGQHDKTQVGYEIPFNRHFYVFKPPRALAEIDSELKGVTDRILTMIGGLTK